MILLDLVVLLLNEEIEDILWLSIVIMEDFSLKFTNDRFAETGGVSKGVNPSRLIIDYPIQSPFWRFEIISFSIQIVLFSLTATDDKSNRADLVELHCRNLI